MKLPMGFKRITRDELRNVFQPSKILLAVVAGTLPIEYNVLPLCFHTWCSYSPLLYCVSIQHSNYSVELFKTAHDFVLALAGENMLNQVVFCGTHTGRNCNKVEECGIRLTKSYSVSTPGILDAIANIELSIREQTQTGDHLMVIGEVLAISLSDTCVERPLLAIGPNTKEYEVLWQHDIHTIGVIPRKKLY